MKTDRYLSVSRWLGVTQSFAIGALACSMLQFVFDRSVAAESLAEMGQVRTIALRGVAPFENSGGFVSPVLNDRGDVTFRRGFSSNSSVWTTAGGLRRIMTIGDPAIGFPPDTIFYDIDIRSPISASQGRSAFQADATSSDDPSNRLYGIWTESADGGLRLVAGSGTPVPGSTSGDVFGNFGSPAIAGDGGHIGFWGAVNGPDLESWTNVGIWVEGDPGDSLRAVAQGGDPTPGVPDATFDAFFSFPAINTLGQVALVSRLAGGGHHYGVWTEGGRDGLRLVAFEGDQLAALPTGTLIGQASSNRILLNDGGETAFDVDLVGEGVTENNNQAIFVEAPGDGIRMVVRRGDRAPGIEGDVRFSYLGFLALNMAGQAAFPAALVGDGVDSTNDTAIFTEAGGDGLRLLARHGDPAPGVDGANFALFGNNWGIHFNDRGQTLFSAFYDPVDVNPESAEGFWIERRPGEIVPALLEGDVIEVAPGDFRTVRGFRTARFGRIFNDRGEFVVGINFTDGTDGVFLIGGGPDTSPVPGDVNFDGRASAADIDLVCAAIADASRNPLYDLNESGGLDSTDLAFVLADRFGTFPGDTNLDGQVNSGDAATVAQHFGATTGPRWALGDLTCDGNVTLADWDVLQRHFGQGIAAFPGSAPVPEPSSLLLCVLASAIYVAIGRRRRNRSAAGWRLPRRTTANRAAKGVAY